MPNRPGVGAVLIDTHVIHWWSAEPKRVSPPARKALEAADELVIAAISWYELAGRYLNHEAAAEISVLHDELA